MLPPQLPPQLPSAPTLPTAVYQEPWTITPQGYDRMYVYFNGVLSRTEVFRLIGQLERAGAAM